jgi:hypothetical protein
MSKPCAKIIASVVSTKADKVSGICLRQNYIGVIRNFKIRAPQWIFEMMMLERVACMERMINTHNIVDSTVKSTRKI